MNCQIEFANDDMGMPCGKPAVAKCADCGSSICDDCRVECCGDSFCGQGYDYHLNNFCARKPVQNESQHTTPFRSAPYKAS
jgi:hypothetical protein